MMRNDGSGIPLEILDCDGLTYEEFLQQQEMVLHSLAAFGTNKDSSSCHGESSDRSQLSGHEDGSSQHGSSDSQLALDEALARSLQELEDDFDDLNISQSDSAGTAVGNREARSTAVPNMTVDHNVEQDDIDPDNMTYEQLQLLQETVGVESRGLPEELIANLRTFTYKRGWFSKRKEEHECPICKETYSNGDKLINLPCAHQFHSRCIKQWLRDARTCPICMTEVTRG